MGTNPATRTGPFQSGSDASGAPTFFGLLNVAGLPASLASCRRFSSSITFRRISDFIASKNFKASPFIDSSHQFAGNGISIYPRHATDKQQGKLATTVISGYVYVAGLDDAESYLCVLNFC